MVLKTNHKKCDFFFQKFTHSTQDLVCIIFSLVFANIPVFAERRGGSDWDCVQDQPRNQGTMLSVKKLLHQSYWPIWTHSEQIRLPAGK